MLVRELIAKLQTLPQDVPVAACAATFEGPDILSDFQSVAFDEEDNCVMLALDYVVTAAKDLPIEDAGVSFAELLDDSDCE